MKTNFTAQPPYPQIVAIPKEKTATPFKVTQAFFDTPPGSPRPAPQATSLRPHKPLSLRHFYPLKTQNSKLKIIEIYPLKYANLTKNIRITK